MRSPVPVRLPGRPPSAPVPGDDKIDRHFVVPEQRLVRQPGGAPKGTVVGVRDQKKCVRESLSRVLAGSTTRRGMVGEASTCCCLMLA